MIATLAAVGYAGCWLYAARKMFARWRPLRAPLCASTDKCRGGKHGAACWRQRKPDRRRAAPNSDAEAFGAALAVSAAWPVLLAWKIITAAPPELEHEKEARLKALDAAIARKQAELDRS